MSLWTWCFSGSTLQLDLTQWQKTTYKAKKKCAERTQEQVCDFSECQWFSDMLVRRIWGWVWDGKGGTDVSISC
jgi:hypothetical protein